MPLPKCEICDDDFSSEDGDHSPRNLKCCHTLCEGCIKKLLNYSRIVCPFCREPTEVPGNNIKSLHKNFSLIQVIKTTLVEEAEARIIPKCKAHPYNLAEFFCVNPDCSSNDKLMCRTCEDFGVHKGHAKYLLITRIENSGNSLQKAISDLQKKLRDIDQNVEELKKAQTLFNENGELFQKKKNQITNFYSKLREKVNEREKEALSELKDVARTARVNNTKSLLTLMQVRSIYDELISEAKELLKKTSATSFREVEAILNRSNAHIMSQEKIFEPNPFENIKVNIRPIEIPMASIEYCAKPSNSVPRSSGESDPYAAMKQLDVKLLRIIH
ncbi:RING-type domain-containing protein [Caenorhabditis elegans]|uniref:RING-type domain-containing protein n=1 Tax=Caenorhabditis elegans TaxID=6239 RepID=O16614_CAEEL|nr:RING-type domain-containing protein [Caenorhabditis elegans]CCD61640.1 RING-type domain-containing protein [Caenorhabditis elegans]|eukprot:NP_494232.2 Uncharacterized protein CELE_B0281.3 [Caenorhabditis elegans]